MIFKGCHGSPGTQAAQFDIDTTYCRIPTAFKHWKFLVVSITNPENNGIDYFVDMTHPFGLKSTNNNLGYAINATIAILQLALPIPFISKWVDDVVILQYPSCQDKGKFAYNITFDQICSLFQELGWPLSHAKLVDFVPCV